MTPNQRIAAWAVSMGLLDQITKAIVLKTLPFGDEKTVLDGFFKFVHWGNTGAAWSMFHNNNATLAVISLIALLALFLYRHHFDTRTKMGQTALGLIFGGIIGNLVDRLFRDHVVDFLRFYLHQRGGSEIGFPAFNVADVAICTGVGLLFIITWKAETDPNSVTK